MGARNQCVFRGQANLAYNGLRLGKSRCPICGAEIVVTAGDTDNYGFVPPHNKPKRKRSV